MLRLKRPSALRPLTHRMFRYLWIATIVSNIGTWMQNVSAAWVMTSLTTSSVMVALLQSASSLPTVFFSIPAGALADIVNRRNYMIIVQLALVTVGAAMTLFFYMGWMTPWLLLFFTFAIGTGTALNAPAWFATTPELVPPEDLTEAITLNGIGVNASRAIGPALAGIIISSYSPGMAFALNAVSFAGLAITLLQWKYQPKASPLPAERFFGSMKAGIRYVRRSRHLHRIFLHAAGFFTCASSLWALLPLIARHELHQTAGGYGVLLTSMGLGAISAAFVLPLFRHRFSRNHMVFGASLLFALGLLILSAIPPIVVANIAMLLMGIAWIAGVSSLHVTAQTSTANWVRARALSVYLVVLFGGMGFGSMLWGHIADWSSVSKSMHYSGIAMLISAVILRFIDLPKIDNSDFTPSQHWGELLLGHGTPHDDKPVLINVDYMIAEEDTEAFLDAVKQLESSRRRDGAMLWAICRHVEDKNRFTECFMVESWLEHLRQHERVTLADKRLSDRVRAFHKGEHAPKVTHLLVENDV